MLVPVLLFLHAVGFAAFVGGGFAQQQFMRLSAKESLSNAVRDEYERLASALVTRAEVPGLLAQVATGGLLTLVQPTFMQMRWLQAKVAAVAILVILSQLEMLNARRLVRARETRGDAAAGEIAARKRRHLTMGVLGAVMALAATLLVTVLRGPL